MEIINKYKKYMFADYCIHYKRKEKSYFNTIKDADVYVKSNKDIVDYEIVTFAFKDCIKYSIVIWGLTEEAEEEWDKKVGFKELSKEELAKLIKRMK